MVKSQIFSAVPVEVLAKLCAAVSKELAAGHCLADFLAAGTGVGDDDGDLHERLYPLSPLQICARNGTRGRMPQKTHRTVFSTDSIHAERHASST